MGANNKIANNGIRDKAGKFVAGHPKTSNGRPPGSPNKFTLVKEAMVEVFEENLGKERFKKLFIEDRRGFIQAMKMIIEILPKDVDFGGTPPNFNVTIEIANENKITQDSGHTLSGYVEV